MKHLFVSALLGTVFSLGAQASSCPAPADDLPALVREPLLEKCDMAAAYHAARLSLARGQDGKAFLWLDYLTSNGWPLGLESDSPLAASLNDAPKAMMSSHVMYMLGARDFFAEGITADESTGRIFVGSLARNEIMVVGDEVGQITWPLPDAGDLRAIYGIKYDEAAHELWVLRNRADVTPESKPAPQAQLLVLDGITGAVKRTASPKLAALAELNDLCLTPTDAYVTDSRNHALYRVDRATLDFTTIALPDIRYPNGIACKGDSVYVADWRGITRLDTASGKSERLQAPAGETLGGIDGLVVMGDSFIAVQNGFKFPRVIKAKLDGSTVETLDISHPAYAVPTTGTMLDGAFVYIANSQMDRIGAADTRGLKPLTVLTLRTK